MTSAMAVREASGQTGRIVAVAFVTLAMLLLVLALLWRVPMMLWDHLDLVPIYERHLQGALRIADLFRIHGGHLHAGAYAVLLATTDLSHGATWLDVVASLVFLFANATVITMLALRLARDRDLGLAYVLMLIAFALYPGHLANLQWGWQVAVFVCLAAAALACAACAFASFAIGFAVLPVA